MDIIAPRPSTTALVVPASCCVAGPSHCFYSDTVFGWKHARSVRGPPASPTLWDARSRCCKSMQVSCNEIRAAVLTYGSTAVQIKARWHSCNMVATVDCRQLGDRGNRRSLSVPPSKNACVMANLGVSARYARALLAFLRCGLAGPFSGDHNEIDSGFCLPAFGDHRLFAAGKTNSSIRPPLPVPIAPWTFSSRPRPR